VGSIFNVAVVDEDGLVRGVATVGRPVARMLCDGFTLEVNRVATDGFPNACSFLYGAVSRVARSLGYNAIVTYTLPEEGGASLRAAGWVADRQVRGSGWVHSGEVRSNDWPLGDKLRWRRELCDRDAQGEVVWPLLSRDDGQLELLSG